MSSPVFKILRLLDEAGIKYLISRYRDETIDIHATLVGERIEISVFEDDHVEISRFFGNENVLNGDILSDIIAGYVGENEK
ncbi:hypothetical protein EOS93_19975 [Rhizobium sp. RMa-01]|uniref:hypothetical protein n=1 Tax=unclassified Rhizobium TaxID=2613769 RepID=UPI0008DACA29|nr:MULTISPECIES: hypothetical protein [unclassified Rhizobium]OHV18407.1 hypothetical protein BBJ66_19315 [Rhizobium sp. RSm-3]RVU09140.1 hypothetical protein EOS93_19975 [Rhizobium sp. RMa-01]